MREIRLSGKDEVAVFGESCGQIMQKSHAKSKFALQHINSTFTANLFANNTLTVCADQYGNNAFIEVTILQVMPMPDGKILVEYIENTHLIHEDNQL